MIAGNTNPHGEAQIRQLIVDRDHALCAKDLDGVMGDYATELIGFDMKRPFQIKGANGSRRVGAICLFALAAVVLVTGAGCRMAMRETKVEPKVHAQKDIAASQDQVRLRMRGLVGPMSGEIEQTADSIIAGTTNRAVQQAALQWKIEGVPALREALFQPIPFMAVMETWVLLNQMADYFENGPGKEELGQASAQAAATCRRMEEEFTQVAASGTISGDVSKARAFARKWAAEHPIRYSIDSRQSTQSRVFEQEFADSFSAGEAVAEITTTLDDLNRRLEIYSHQLFRQARWEAERFKLELLSDRAADQAVLLAERMVRSAEQAVATVERLTPAIERAASVAQDAPNLVASERETAIKALQAELTRTMQFVREERIAALKELHEAVAQERKALISDVNQIILRVVDHSFERLARLVAVAMAAAIMAAFFGLLLVRWIFFRRPLEIRRERPPVAEN